MGKENHREKKTANQNPVKVILKVKVNPETRMDH
jgi:hypothetical protein